MSSEKNIDSLIGDLTQDLKLVKCMGCPARRIIPWILAAALYTACAVYFIGIRHDVNTLFESPIFAFEILLMSFIGIMAALSSSYLSVPDMCGKQWLVPTTLTSLGIFAAWCIIRGAIEGMYMPQIHLDHCMGEGAFMAIIPVAILIFMMKQGTTTRPILMSFMNVLSITALGYVALRFTCSSDTIAHATISHLVPYTVFGAVLGIMARKLYKW